MKEPYIWNNTIRIKKKDGTYDYEQEDIDIVHNKVKVKKLERNNKRKNK